MYIYIYIYIYIYTDIDTVRDTYQNLLCMGVATDNLEAVVKCVLDNLTNLKVDCLSKSTFARLIFIEPIRLSHF